MAKTSNGRSVWNNLLNAARTAHEAHPELNAFCAFPDDIIAQPVSAYSINAAALMAGETDLSSPAYADLCAAFQMAGPHAHWRETYADTNIGQDFMDRFGCYCLIGDGGAFGSNKMRAWVVYMPADLWYTWHQHPAEEMYLVLAGQAAFLRDGAEPEVLQAGGTSFHASNQSHAMRTSDHPVMAYVVWRTCFESPPVLTPS